MLLCKPKNINLDVKLSSYKKIGKFLSTMQKEGFIEYKEAKKNNLPTITKINRGIK